MALRRIAAYVWAAPNTLLGLAVGMVSLCTGGRVHRVEGVAEFAGGLPGRLLQTPWRFAAVTLGHVVIGTCERELEASRLHEQVHVRQYERWGPLFLPAYALSSAIEALRGRRAYRDNCFEREAYAVAPPQDRAVSSGSHPRATSR